MFFVFILEKNLSDFKPVVFFETKAKQKRQLPFVKEVMVCIAGDLLASQGLMCRQESKESLSSDHSGSAPSGDSDDQWLSQVRLGFEPFVFVMQLQQSRCVPD